MGQKANINVIEAIINNGKAWHYMRKLCQPRLDIGNRAYLQIGNNQSPLSKYAAMGSTRGLLGSLKVFDIFSVWAVFFSWCHLICLSSLTLNESMSQFAFACNLDGSHVHIPFLFPPCSCIVFLLVHK